MKNFSSVFNASPDRSVINTYISVTKIYLAINIFANAITSSYLNILFVWIWIQYGEVD
jgi:hypothetical protein